MDLPETMYASVGDSQVAYQVLGDGPIDLLYFAGLGSHVELIWDYPPSASFFSRLASFTRLIIYDRRGSGASDPVPNSAISTWDGWADDALAVLDAAGSDQAAVFAEGDAGPTAVLVAAMHPERVRALILADASARYMVADDYPIGLSSELVDVFVNSIRHLWGTSASVRLVQPDADAELLRWGAKLLRASATPGAAAAQYHHILTTTDVRRALPLVQAPTLVLCTRGHPFLSPEHGQFLANHIGGAKLVELPPAETYFSSAGYARVIGEVAAFLTGEHPEVDIDHILTTVLFTDIVESTRALVALGDQRWRALLDAHDRAIREQFRHFRGQEIKTTGDGFMACFDSPVRGIRCAQAVVDAARSLGLEVRSGLHTGECQLRDHDLSGLTVHVAARIGALAQAGEVLSSSMVKQLVAGTGIDFAERGERRLTGVPGTWQLYTAKA
ncbi:MAG TPA: adenylate/guanylate cyclase domain-containing protein [Acidimicrobiales bacterium]|nr:adenylate/guanylate cyclase domain-containing protein [Acidimicrobiales bacterium]